MTVVVVEPSAAVVVVEVDPPLDCDEESEPLPEASLEPLAACACWWPLFSAFDISSRLTLPSEFVSSFENTSSACAVLVPPAPSAFSNSDLVILPSPSASICENRSFSAASWLVEVEDVEVDDVELDDVELLVPLVLSDDWLCAASSALIVSGAICGQLPELTDEVAPLLVLLLLLLLSIANGLVVALCDDPVFSVDDEDFEFVSD